MNRDVIEFGESGKTGISAICQKKIKKNGI